MAESSASNIEEDGSKLKMFSVRIVSTDHYMSTPIPGLDVQYADQRCAEVKKVPVVRIFGSTSAGQKTCVHVHGVFPYLYVPYDGTVPVDRYLRQFASSLDKAINVAQGHGQSNLQHVYKIVLVTGRSMYGYHDKEQQFLKIYLYNPSMVRKAADLLLGGAVLNKPFQPHESHIPYTLQLFIDYNLYGMNMINVAAVKFRRQSDNVDHEILPLSQGSDEGFGSDPRTPVSFTALLNRSGSMTPSQRMWQRENIPSELYLDASVEKLSTCELEVDVVAADILNRLEVGANIGTNPGLAALWEDERQRRRDRGESTEIAPPGSQERDDIEAAESERILRERLQQILLDLQPYMDSQSDTESEQSQDIDFPLTQASDLDIHVSPDDVGGSQDTVMIDAEDKPVVNVESIQRVVSFSQSFCDVRPDTPKISSQDKSLVDILASLADDTSPPSSQNAAADVIALEEQDSILSQLSQPRDNQVDKEEEEEILEMSQNIWEGEEKKEDNEDEFNLAGMDDTWIDSQLDPSDKDGAEGAAADDGDSDAGSDILPQYDGPPDEKGDSKRAEAKQAILKRLGMRGPISNLHMPNRNSVSQYDSYGNMVASNPFADSHSTSQNVGAYSGSHMNQFPPSGNWNQNWGRNMLGQNIGGVHHSPSAGSSPQHHSPGSYQQPKPVPTARSQYSPINNQESGMPSFQMSPGSQSLHNQYRDQSFCQGSPQSQLSPGSYPSQYPGSQGFSPVVSQQMSPPYTAQQANHAQTHSSQSDMPYSPPVTYSPGQNLRTPDTNRFFQGNSGQFQHSTFHMPPFSRPDQMSAPACVMSMSRQIPASQSHDLMRANQKPTQTPSHIYRVNSNSSHDSSLQDPYQENKIGMNSAQQNVSNLHMYTAQHASAIVSSQSQTCLRDNQVAESQNSNFTQKRPNPAELSNKIVANLLEHGKRKGNVGRGMNLGTPHSLHSQSQHPNQVTSPDSHGNVRRFLSNTLIQRQQKPGSGEYTSPLGYKKDQSRLHLGPFGNQMVHEGSGFAELSDGSPRAVQQPSPRTPTGEPGLQSPGSAGSKQSEQFVGPVTKFYNQRRHMYEQISPPVTPVSYNATDLSKKSQSISSPSSGFSEQQISPLQRLLLDNSDLPLSKQDQRQRSPSRSSLSSLSSVGSEKPANQSQQDLFHPVSRNTQDKSKLFSLLSSMKTDSDTWKETRNTSDNTQHSQSDSQQDLFADSILSDIGSVENTTADSLTSLFSDDLQVNTGGQQQTVDASRAGQNKNGAVSTSLNDDFASLSSLESFVGSVRNETTEFGVNFNKTSAIEHSCEEALPDRNITHSQQDISQVGLVPCSKQNTDPVRSDCQQNVGPVMSLSSSLPGIRREAVPPSIQQNEGPCLPPQTGPVRGPPVLHQSPSRNYNLTDWPQYPVPTNVPKPGRGGGQRRRGRPPVRKGLNFPVETFGIVQKKRRGRPKKNGDNFTLPSTFQQQGNLHTPSGSQFSHHLQNQYSMPPNVDIPPNVDLSQNITMNMPYYQNQLTNQSQSFSQLLEGDSNDILAELTNDSSQVSQFGDNPGMLQGVQAPGNQFMNEVPLNQDVLSVGQQYSNNTNNVQGNFTPSINHSQSQLHQRVESFKPHQPQGMVPGFQGQEYSFPQQHEPHFQQYPLDDRQQLTTISLTEAMQISEPSTNFNPDFSNFNSEELSQILPELQSGQTNEMNPQMVDNFESIELNNQIKSPSKKVNMQSAMRRKQQQFISKAPRDITSIMELMKYRQQSGSTPKTSAAYKFRFKVPTPVFKRLKFRVKRTSESESSQLDFVRMHPKDARKYSLLKIGREIIQIKRLSEAMIDEIREKLKVGEDIRGIPPPVRQVPLADISQTGSIIADLLSADSPLIDEMIGTGDVEDELSRSFQGIPCISGCEDTFMVKKQSKFSLSKDKKANSMFRGKNIANIPHLKKYRAGFPYFGKGNVGRGASHAKVRANNKNLKPEYEDDENIVLKDVCLTDASDGVLTPIKSRTPIAGRSPAHYGGGVHMPEIENQDKNVLESKLKDLEYDLDLNQSGNSQMFQDILGEKELQNKAEYENAEDSDDKEEQERMKAKCKLENTGSEMIVDSDDCSNAKCIDKALAKVESEESVTVDRKENGNGETLTNDSGVLHENILSTVKSDSDERSYSVKMEVNHGENINLGDSIGRLKKQFEKQLSNGLNGHRNNANGLVNAYDEGDGARRSRSSSRESQLIPSQKSSRRNSVVLSGMSGDEEKCFWSVGSVKRSQSSDGSDSYKSDSKRAKMYKSSANGSSSACSRKSSRSSSLDQDNRKKKCKSKKKQKKSYRYDSDSDGIPGVDYIVVNRFKGGKELRVVIDKLKIDKEANTVFDEKVNGLNSKMKHEHMHKAEHKCLESDSKVKSNSTPSKSFTGFSAEFEKFLANQSNPTEVVHESDSDTEDFDFPERVNHPKDIEKCEKNTGFKDNHGVSKSEFCLNLGSKDDGTEGIFSIKEETYHGNVKNAEGEEATQNEEKIDRGVKADRRRRSSGMSATYEGLRDFSSSSDEDQFEKQLQMGPKSIKKKQGNSDGKKKKASKSIHDGSVFCSKARKKRTKPKSRPSKLMCSLSALHDATLEKLTSSQVFSDMETGNSSSSQSPAKSRDISDIDSPVRWQPRVKTPDFELYLDRTDDHVSQFEDTMYKLAYLSPMSSDSNTDSPPRPLSPKELRKLDGTVEQLCEKITEHNEKKMTMSDILKTMQAETELRKADANSANFAEIPGTPNKIAVAKTEALTLKDIKSLCLSEKVDENKSLISTKEEIVQKRLDSPPPDLGPPVLESENEKPEDGSRPPHLSPNRSESDTEASFVRGSDLSSNEVNGKAPPFLTPCRSPRVSLSPRYTSPRCAQAPDGTEAGDYFSLPIERDSSSRAGRSPGACSSSGSINVIHSEEFSDISDDSDNDTGLRKRGKPKYTDSPTMPCLSPRLCSEKRLASKINSDNDERQQKLREIKIFEERHRKSDMGKNYDQEKHKIEQKGLRKADENRNNIFELLSVRNPILLNRTLDQDQKATDINMFLERDANAEISSMKEGVRNGFSRELYDRKRTFTNSAYDDEKINVLDSVQNMDSAKKYSQNKTLSPDTILNCMTHNSHSRNYENDFYKLNNPGRNGELSHSLSQNDFIQPLNFRNSKAFHTMSMDLNRTALERTLPNNTYGNFSPPKNLFENLNLSRPSSRLSEKGIYSGDLFESCSESSSRHSYPSLNRSLSDNGRTGYSIIRSDKLNDSIMRSVQNYANREKDNHMTSPEIPFLEFGGGEGKRKRKENATHQNTGTTAPGRNCVSFNLGNSDNSDDSFGNRDHDKNQGQQTFSGSNVVTGCQVITPYNGPPSLESILVSANQHGLAALRPTGAFYSNYGDVPEKPREGGGHVLKLPSTLVKELEEFDSSSLLSPSTSPSSSLSSSITGIKNWRTVLCARDSLLLSQTGSSELLDRLDREPALKYAVTGDQSVIISPCILPPPKKSVEKWNKGRKVYKDLKVQTLQKSDSKVKEKNKESETKEKNERDTEAVIKDSEKSKLTPSKQESEFTRLTERRHSVTKEKDEEVIQVKTGERVQEIEKSKFEQDIKSPESEKDEFHTSQKFGAIQDDDSTLLHSTPLLRRGSTELFEPECTPISGEKRPLESQSDQGQNFVTPKRIKPLRRLSSNTDSTLRRAILSSQIKQQYGTPALQRRDTSQIEGPSLKNSFGFKHSQQNWQDAKALHEYQCLTVLSIEVHVETRGELRPDPEVDSMTAIFYSIFNDVHPDRGTRNETGVFIVDPESADGNLGNETPTNQKAPPKRTRPSSPQPGPSNAPDSPKVKRSDAIASTSKVTSTRSEVIMPQKKTLLQKSGIHGLSVTYVKDEEELLRTFIDFVHRWNPDILVGYEIQMLSWGYVLQRASTLSVNLAQAISRIPSAKNSSHISKEQDEYGADHMSEIHIAGRIVLNLWRLLRHEVNLNVYSFENVAFHVLHRRIPLFPFRNLTTWFKHRTHLHRWKVMEHYVTRVKANLEIMDQLDILGRTSEFARVFGIEFYHVLSRGSQYRVESMMLRIAKPMNYIPVSPSVHQRARSKAPECIPLTLEPESKFYTDPVVVVDFQSLYPSIMIAYNYCFSTCLGRVEWFQKAHEGPIELGCTSLGLEPSVIRKLSDEVTISPNGVVFCKQSVKRGVLPVMVEEILKTRLMVKKAMSSYKGDKTLSRMLNARQMGLKLIANVTYGYTAANFSGRMPCIEVADSIVRKARETLERSIKLVEDTPRWGAKVVYGDTDSMFIQLKGRSKDEAFKIGQDIANSVTAMFPKPIKLKFEKVYLPCVLQTKKRYVGFMYETPDQKEPVYDAKGIETVRRDNCSAVSKILERSLKVLFTSKDVSEVKLYIQQQCQKVMEGSVSLQDFVFAKEYRGMPGYKPGACVPALEIAKKNLRQDRRSEPRVGERVPYVIVYGSPGLPLIQLVRTPGEVLQDPSLRLNATYYITKQILPPLNRFLSLIGANVFSWYQEMPHSAGRVVSHAAGHDQGKKGTISQYFATSNCPTCDCQTKRPICEKCMRDPQLVCMTLNDRITRWDRVGHNVQQICGTCIGTSETATIKACSTLDCPVQFRRARAFSDMTKAQTYRDLLDKVFK